MAEEKKANSASRRPASAANRSRPGGWPTLSPRINLNVCAPSERITILEKRTKVTWPGTGQTATAAGFSDILGEASTEATAEITQSSE